MDDGNILHNRISTQDYEQCQDDIMTVSGMAEDIRDALLDYQVCGDKAYAAVVPLKSRRFDRWPSNGRCTTRVAG